MRSLEEVAAVGDLVRLGLNDSEISRQTGISRTTVRDWRRTSRWSVSPDTKSCARCGAALHRFDNLPPDYAYLLGLYLGDGWLSSHPRGVYRLRIVLDDRYPGIIEECRHAVQRVLPENKAAVQPRTVGACSEVYAFSKQLPCLFPQHGPGRKHERPIELATWQQDIVNAHPEKLLRGLLHSDGCRFINPIRHGDKLYTYPRYAFSNASSDIRRIFCDACDLLGIEWRVMNARNISVARRESVARLDEFVGPKA